MHSSFICLLIRAFNLIHLHLKWLFIDRLIAILLSIFLTFSSFWRRSFNISCNIGLVVMDSLLHKSSHLILKSISKISPCFAFIPEEIGAWRLKNLIQSHKAKDRSQCWKLLLLLINQPIYNKDASHPIVDHNLKKTHFVISTLILNWLDKNF